MILLPLLIAAAPAAAQAVAPASGPVVATASGSAASRTAPPPAVAGVKYWIFLRDKGNATSLPSLSTHDHLTERALRRRARMMPPGATTQFEDLPLHAPYLDALRGLGATIAAESRWMNAVSAVVPAGRLEAASRLPFVERIEPVRSVGRGRMPEEGAAGDRGAVGGANGEPHSALLRASASTPASLIAVSPASPFPLPDYGPSFAQLDAVRVPAVHALGITGREIVVGILDTGFRWRAHASLEGMTVLGEYDFVAGDGNTADGPADPPGQDAHGTLVLSVLGGNDPGRLVGPAFDASFLLAKTENAASETQVEEDFWAAGIEWLEANGADVINSSLGYNTWDDGSGYSWAGGDFDGATSVAARAAARAARLGVVLCVSMGNEGNGDGVTGTMLTPADADTVLSLGAATFDGFVSTSSSTGPTSDGRVKPDLAAPGSAVVAASTAGRDAYLLQSGTSLASPIAAGAAALLLSARPDLSPVRVRDILRASADSAKIRNHSGFPNNFAGWGYLDALAAVASSGPLFSNRPAVRQEPDGAVITTAVLSSSGILPDGVVLRHRDDRDAGLPFETVAMTLDSSMLFPTSGLYSAKIPPHPVGAPIAIVIAATDSAGRSRTSPAPEFHDRWVLEYGDNAVNPPPEIPASLRLLQNYPNPFNGGTNIVFDLPADGAVTVTVYNVLGQRVATPFEGTLRAGTYDSRAPVFFDAGGLPGGMYLYRVSGPSGTRSGKMLLIR